ncbi:hypothetical protein CPB85DRAFT_1449617 [Mucidula mucida]|nr:hypothetical protein CPB85DRAFT_1449617 [Mucidula mucida]
MSRLGSFTNATFIRRLALGDWLCGPTIPAARSYPHRTGSHDFFEQLSPLVSSRQRQPRLGLTPPRDFRMLCLLFADVCGVVFAMPDTGDHGLAPPFFDDDVASLYHAPRLPLGCRQVHAVNRWLRVPLSGSAVLSVDRQPSTIPWAVDDWTRRITTGDTMPDAPHRARFYTHAV